MPSTADVVVIGAGIAGASAAWALAEQLDVVLVETEAAAGTHSTGRSAALLTETIGAPEVRALVAASRRFLTDPPEGFADHPLTGPRGVLWITADDEAGLRASAAGWAALSPGVHVLDATEAQRLVPVLRSSAVACAVHEEDGLDLDVDGLLQGFVRGLRRRGGTLVCGAPVLAIRGRGRGWDVETTAGTVSAAVVVDAAGAWADVVASMAGARTVALQPLKRTAFTFRAPDRDGVDRWPLVVEAAETFYVKPEAGRLLGSLADETPSDPCDAKPEEEDVALAVERIEAALDLQVRGVNATWAGLRTFAPDRVPVVGPDPDADGFVWLAGQGGYGIKTSPALAEVVAHHVLGTPWPPVLADRGVTPADLSPARLRP